MRNTKCVATRPGLPSLTRAGSAAAMLATLRGWLASYDRTPSRTEYVGAHDSVVRCNARPRVEAGVCVCVCACVFVCFRRSRASPCSSSPSAASTSTPCTPRPRPPRRFAAADSFVCPALAGRLFCAKLHGVFALGTSQIVCSAHFSTSPSPCAPSRTPWLATATLPCAVVAHECLLGAPAGSTSGRRV